MDHRQAGKIMEIQQGEPAIGSPCPVSNDGVDKACHSDAIEDITPEAAAADHGTGCDGGSRICKGELEDPEAQQRNTRRHIGGTQTHYYESLRSDPWCAWV